MLSLREWRAIKETTADPVTADQVEPAQEDWEFYRTKVQGRAMQYLKWLTEELAGKKLSLYRKGFIIQEVMDALGLDISQVVRITTNIKRALQKKNSMQQQQQQPQPQQQPQQSAMTTPTSQPVQGNMGQDNMGFRA